MSAFQWLNNVIKKLHAKGDSSRPAMLPGLYVMLMIKYFEKTPKTIPMFADIGIDVDQEGNADYATPDFPRTVCGLALLCGKNFGTLDLIHVEADLPRALDL
eukprot:1422814-Rhodomonas_salina.1